MFDTVRSGDMLDHVGYVSYFFAANAGVAAAELPRRVNRIIFRANFIVFGTFVCGTVAARVSLAFAESQLHRIAAQPPTSCFCLAEMLAYGGRACMTLGAAGYGASIGNRFAKLIWWQ